MFVLYILWQKSITPLNSLKSHVLFHDKPIDAQLIGPYTLLQVGQKLMCFYAIFVTNSS